MGADAFSAFYGIRVDVDPDDHAQIDALDAGTHPVCVAAAALGLAHESGRSTDGLDYFVYVGRPLGDVGGESGLRTEIDPDGLEVVIADVDAALGDLGRPERPGLHLQVHAQY